MIFTPSRRKFFKNSALAFLAATVSPSIFAASEGAQAQSLKLSADTFQPLLNSDFTLTTLQGKTIKTTLIDVLPSKDGQSFSLMWETNDGPKEVGSEIYQVQHEAFENIQMFISPVEEVKHTQRMEAIYA